MSGNQSDRIEEVLLKQEYGLYRATAPIKKGNFAHVFAGYHIDNGTDVAIKVLDPFSQDPMAPLEFDDEGVMLKKLTRCGGVVTLHDSGAIQLQVEAFGNKFNVPVKYHVLDKAEGCLDEYIRDDGIRNRLPWSDRLRLWRTAILGLHQMHLKKYAHRDIKCENCLLFIGGERQLISRVADLGRSRDCTSPARLGASDYALSRGDLRCAAPENLTWQGQDSWAAFQLADIYGAGSLLYELVTGQPITTVALGPSRDLIAATERDAMRGRFVSLASLRPRYNKAMRLLEPTAPPVLRERLSTVMSQICSPVPEERLPRAGLGRRRQRGAGLLWLLNQADILRKLAAVQDRRRLGYRARRG